VCNAVTTDSDLPIEMIDELLDERTADAIVSGAADRSSLPPELERIARLVDLARSPASQEEVAGEAAMVGAFLEAAAIARAPVQLHDQRPRSAKRRTAKVVAALAFVALTGTAAAAATNHLPESVQTAVSDAGDHVGVHLPKPKHGPAKGNPSVNANGAQGHGPDATGPAKAGLCTAHAARGDNPSDAAGGVAERNLAAAASGAGQTIDEYCADVVHPPSEATDSDASGSSSASDDGSSNAKNPAGTGKPDDTGKPGDTGKPESDSTASDHPNNGKAPVDPGGGRGNPSS
jgi:hypothetical protein